MTVMASIGYRYMNNGAKQRVTKEAERLYFAMLVLVLLSLCFLSCKDVSKLEAPYEEVDETEYTTQFRKIVLFSDIELKNNNASFESSMGRHTYILGSLPEGMLQLLSSAELGDCLQLGVSLAVGVKDQEIKDKERKLVSVASCQQSSLFDKYLTKRYTGKHHFLAKGDGAGYPTILKAMSEEPVQFAGKYVFGGWGCGTSCYVPVYLDVRSGKVRNLDIDINPHVICKHSEDNNGNAVSGRHTAGLYSESDSRLLVAVGWRSEAYYSGNEVPCSVSLFEERKGELVKVTITNKLPIS